MGISLDATQRRGLSQSEVAVFLVVGGSGAVGARLLEVLSDQGEDTMATRRGPLPPAGALKGARSGNVDFLPLNLADSSEIKSVASNIRSNYPPLSGVAFCSGMAHGGTIQLTKGSDLETVMKVNALGPVDFARRLVPHSRPRARFVFLSSVASRFVQRGNSIYGASKVLLERLVDGLSVEIAPDNVRFFTVSPGAIDSAMFGKMSPPAADELLQFSPTSAPVAAGDVANLVANLLTSNLDTVGRIRLAVD